MDPATNSGGIWSYGQFQSDQNIVISLLIMGGFILVLISYAALNITWGKRGVRRIAESDAKIRESDREGWRRQVQKIVPAFISANTGLAGITFAALIIVIAFIVIDQSQFSVFTGLKKGIVYAALAGAGIATVCWLFSLEQLTQMLSPSIEDGPLERFYLHSMNLWAIGMSLIVVALLLFLIVANAFIAATVGGVTTLIVILYWRIQNGWWPSPPAPPSHR